MTAYDIVVLVVLGASCLLGLIRGLLKEVLSLVAFAAATLAAIWWGPLMYEWLAPYIEAPMLRMGLGYLIVFIAALLLVGLLNMTLAALVRTTGLTPADHGLGGLFGLLRGLVLVLAGTAIAGYTPMPEQPWWKDAMFSGTAQNAVAEITAWLGVHGPDWLPEWKEPVQPPDAGKGALEALSGSVISVQGMQGGAAQGAGL
ncbi:membrane protein required for colicin V production [Kerstersia gyiorum]|uniref:Membrane protein required for colicin V production n=1 Tax=Kerstersia gyiorum TaxID=206506 RepID=A0A4Q7MPM6_9BURK|nr:CvpA family protein [Kerstersia gyiorum]RZS70557.1 membrane protein required for colicin V production [Kerstersia gyiorum]